MRLPGLTIRPLIGGLLIGLSPVLLAIENNITLELEVSGYPSVDNNTNTTEIPVFYNDIAASLEPEFKTSFNEGNTFATLTLFGRWDSRDNARRHGDIRELNLVHAPGNWETMIGIGKVFWGVTESSHLVDVINQTDTLEGFDGEDKLGQPMIRVSRSFEQSTLTLFALPGFREREFLSSDNPLSLPFEVTDGNPIYESNDENEHVDFAVRYSGYLDIIDYGASWFLGTSREPGFLPGNDGRLIPFYPQMEQFGIDLQVTSDAWLWKLEVIRRSFDQNPTDDDFTAAAGGLEYSFYSMADGMFDLGLLAEQHYDSRDDRSTIALQNDLFTGMRFAFNDAESSEVLAGAFIDMDDDTTSLRVEANRRVFSDARVSLEAQAFTNVDPDNVVIGFRDSDFIRLSLEFFF
jgi:hypothetical protein